MLRATREDGAAGAADARAQPTQQDRWGRLRRADVPGLRRELSAALPAPPICLPRSGPWWRSGVRVHPRRLHTLVFVETPMRRHCTQALPYEINGPRCQARRVLVAVPSAVARTGPPGRIRAFRAHRAESPGSSGSTGYSGLTVRTGRCRRSPMFSRVAAIPMESATAPCRAGRPARHACPVSPYAGTRSCSGCPGLAGPADMAYRQAAGAPPGPYRPSGVTLDPDRARPVPRARPARADPMSGPTGTT